jgi:hypothetical protein
MRLRACFLPTPQFNPRLTKDLHEFEFIMNNLNLPRPRKIDVAVSAAPVGRFVPVLVAGVCMKEPGV